MFLQTSIAGIKLNNPLMNAAGCWCNDTNQLVDIYNSQASAVVSKSSTLEPRDGNPPPRLYIDKIGSINSMGLPNHGYKYYQRFGETLSKNNPKKPFIQSLHPFTPDELKTMVSTIKSPIELNVSCPNISQTEKKEKFAEYEQYLDIMHQSVQIWGVKLPPFFHATEFEHMSRLLLKYEAKFITSINSMPNGMMINDIFTSRGPTEHFTSRIAPNHGLGGISGGYIKPFGLANVYRFSKLLTDKVDIIGCGGISTAQDVREYLAVGAKAVQIGTQLLEEGPMCFSRIEKELLTRPKL